MPVANKTRVLGVRVTPAQEALIKSCSDAQGVRVSEFARVELVKAAQQRLVALAGAAMSGGELLEQS